MNRCLSVWIKTDTRIRRNPFLRFTYSFHFTPFRFIPLTFHFTRIRSIPFHLFRYEIRFLLMTPERRALRRSADVRNQTPWQDELRGLSWLFWFEDGQSGADRPAERLSNQFLPFHTSSPKFVCFNYTLSVCVKAYRPCKMFWRWSVRSWQITREAVKPISPHTPKYVLIGWQAVL